MSSGWFSGGDKAEKLQSLEQRHEELEAFQRQLNELIEKLHKKKDLIKGVIEKQINENTEELQQWQGHLFTIVDESLNEKIAKLDKQRAWITGTSQEMESVIEQVRHQLDSGVIESSSSGSDSEIESSQAGPDLDDLLQLELRLEPAGISAAERTELESSVRYNFTVLMNEPRLSLRRTFANVGGIMRGYLRRGQSNLDWIKALRRLEGRELEEVGSAPNKYIGSPCVGLTGSERLSTDQMAIAGSGPQAWKAMLDLWNASTAAAVTEAIDTLRLIAATSEEDILFFLPQLCILVLDQPARMVELRKFLLENCAVSIHFALQTYILVQSTKQSRDPPEKKRQLPQAILKWRRVCEELLTEVRESVNFPRVPRLAGESRPSAHSTEDKPSHEELFYYPLNFMDRLVNISKMLPGEPPDKLTEVVKWLARSSMI